MRASPTPGRRAGLLRRDATWVVLLALALSVLSWWHVLHQDLVLGYKDALSHLMIGRRVVVGESTGLAQLGGIWLPLQHVLISTLAWNDALYLSGFAGSFFSMACHVATCLGLFLVVRDLTGSRAGGWAAAAVLGLNADVLYLQATPMGEPLMYAGMVWAVHAVLRWQRHGSTRWLFLGAGLCALLVLVRYEAWVFSAALWCVVAHACAVRRQRLWRGDQAAQGALLVFGFYMALAVLGWLVWNAVLFGDWLHWYRGAWSSVDQMSRLDMSQVGSWSRSLRTYAWGGIHTAGWLALVGGALGLLVAGARERGGPRFTALLTTTVPPAFLVYGLWSGSQPMRVVEVDGDLYNLRMAVVLLVPAALFTGYLVGVLPRPMHAPGVRGAALAAVVVGSSGLLVSHAFSTPAVPVTAVEAGQARAAYAEQREVGRFVAERTTGRILAESIFNEWVLFPNQDRVVYEGSAGAWDSALERPADDDSDIDVVVMRTTPGDEDSVALALHGSPRLAGFGVVLQTDNFLVLSKGAGDGATRSRQ